MANRENCTPETLRALELSREGFDLLLQGADARAETFFRQALALDSDNVFAHYGIGEVVAREGSPGEALPHYRRAVELADTANRERFIRGLVLTLLRAGCQARDAAKYDTAERYFSEALPFCVDPTLSLSCHEGLAAVYQATGRADAAAREFSFAVDLLFERLAMEEPLT